MKAVVFHEIGDIRLEDVPEPKIKESTDAIVRLTAAAICGTDLLQPQRQPQCLLVGCFQLEWNPYRSCCASASCLGL